MNSGMSGPPFGFLGARPEMFGFLSARTLKKFGFLSASDEKSSGF